eukprot:GHVL01013995.1.p1 GENE.GHVL01013995.1~~GHVL01013995.1.p1  ORF type:complete len:297 (-),score=39.87 GHVL01013995.1:55-945(-)
MIAPTFTPKKIYISKDVIIEGFSNIALLIDNKKYLLVEQAVAASSRLDHRLLSKDVTITQEVEEIIQDYNKSKKWQSFDSEEVVPVSIFKSLNDVPVSLNFIERLLFAFEEPQILSTVSKLLQIFILFTIMLSCAVIVFETVPEFKNVPDGCPDCEPQPRQAFVTLEFICIIIFTIEYGIRLFCVPFSRRIIVNETEQLRIISTEGFKGQTFSRKKRRLFGAPHWLGRLTTWLIQTENIIDLISIIPYYVGLFSGSSHSGLASIRLFRITRVFRVFKFKRFNDQFQVFKLCIYLNI